MRMNAQATKRNPDRKYQRAECTASIKKGRQRGRCRPDLLARSLRSKVQNPKTSDLRLVQHWLYVLLLLRSAQPLNLDGRRLLQHMLRVQLGHLGVMPLFFRSPVLASGEFFVARVLRDPQFVEVCLRAGANSLLVE